MGLLFSAAFCCLSGPVTCTAAPPLCIGGGGRLAICRGGRSPGGGGDGCQGPTASPRHARREDRRSRVRCRALEVGRPRPWVGAAPSPCRRPALGHWADFSPRGVSCGGGSFCQRQKATPAHQGLSLPARKLGGPRPVSEVLTRPRVWCGPWPRRCRLACSPCSCRRTCSPPRRT